MLLSANRTSTARQVPTVRLRDVPVDQREVLLPQAEKQVVLFSNLLLEGLAHAGFLVALPLAALQFSLFGDYVGALESLLECLVRLLHLGEALLVLLVAFAEHVDSFF